ncbi:MAG: triose-phosphate isomerase, partial [archaeon]|nr:triose-phosphate isomerase [archaeon]
GWITASMIKSTGAYGTLINHSEHKFEDSAVCDCIRLSKANDLVTVTCAESSEKAADIATSSPNFIAIEPPELIGGDISVSIANPHIIQNTVREVKDVNNSISVLCGAGIKTRNDIIRALDLGADGVLISSGIIKSKDPRKVLQDLATSL